MCVRVCACWARVVCVFVVVDMGVNPKTVCHNEAGGTVGPKHIRCGMLLCHMPQAQDCVVPALAHWRNGGANS